MKAVIWTRYGPPEALQLMEVERPVPREDQLLVKVHAAAVSRADTEFRRLKLPFLYSLPLRLYLGVVRPARIRILGTEFAGEVAEIGGNVTYYRPGDHVFGYTGLQMGTYAEYLTIGQSPTGLAAVMGRKPANLAFDEAAAAPFGGLEALHALGHASIKSGYKVAIVGAGGSIGTYAVQLARHYGAEVTTVDSAGKLEMLRSIGAQRVIDYRREDFTRIGQQYDVIFDTIGGSSFSRSLKSLKEGGFYLHANPGMLAGLRTRLAPNRGGKRVILWSAGYTTARLEQLCGLLESGALKPVIDRRYPLEQIVEAHSYVDSDQKRGNVVVTIS